VQGTQTRMSDQGQTTSRAVRWVTIVLLMIGLGLLLTYLLTRVAGLRTDALLRGLKDIDPAAVGVVVVLTIAYLYCGSEKWRLVDVALTRGSQTSLSRRACFALSAIGMALGNIFPLQTGTALTRTIGAYVMGGRAVVRGTIGTMYELSFDLLIAAVLVPVSLMAVSLEKGSPIWFVILSASMVGLATALIGPLFRWIDAVARSIGRGAPDSTRSRLVLWGGRLSASGLLEASLGRKLCMLSILRFLLLIAIGKTTAVAIGANLPAWHLAGAMPLAVFSAVFSPTPAGLGVSEWTLASYLHVLGTPLDVGVQWVVSNRLVVFLASIVAAVLGAGWVVLPTLWRRLRYAGSR
jgi:uncharacterized membrane protein YbhN (UPF0104 family)